MKPRKDLYMDPDDVTVAFELSNGYIVRICDWDDEPGKAHVEIWDNEEDMDDNARVYVNLETGEHPFVETNKE